MDEHTEISEVAITFGNMYGQSFMECMTFLICCYLHCSLENNRSIALTMPLATVAYFALFLVCRKDADC